MCPILQSFGNNPLSRDLVHNIAKGIHYWSAQFFRIIGGHPSGSGDLSHFRDCNFSDTIDGVTSTEDKEGRSSLDVAKVGTVLGSSSINTLEKKPLKVLALVQSE